MPEPKPPQPIPNPNYSIGSFEQLTPLKDIWAKERKEGDPKINFTFVFGGHISAKDLEETKIQFQDCDIYIPEMSGWGKNTDFIYSKLSEGTMSPKQADDLFTVMDQYHKKAFQYSFNVEQRRMIYQSRKPIVFIDLREDSKFRKTGDAAIEEIFYDFQRAKNWRETKEVLKKYLQIYAQMNSSRERMMLEELPRRIREVLDRRPDIRKKPEIKVLLFLGADHAPIYKQVEDLAEGGSVQHYPNNNLDNPGHRAEGLRRVQSGEDINSFSDEFLMKIFLEMNFSAIFEKSIKEKSGRIGTRKVLQQIREVIDSFTREEVSEVYEKVSQGRKFRDVVLEICKEKGIEMRGF